MVCKRGGMEWLEKKRYLIYYQRDKKIDISNLHLKHTF